MEGFYSVLADARDGVEGEHQVRERDGVGVAEEDVISDGAACDKNDEELKDGGSDEMEDEEEA